MRQPISTRTFSIFIINSFVRRKKHMIIVDYYYSPRATSYFLKLSPMMLFGVDFV